MDTNTLTDDLHVAAAWRYRCFGAGASSASACTVPASWWKADPARFDAVTFYCDEHAPEGANPIAREGEYLELCISGLIVISATTLRRDDAGLEAVCAIQEAVARIGGTFQGVKLAGCLRRPLPILGQKRRPDAPGRARNGDPAGGP